MFFCSYVNFYMQLPPHCGFMMLSTMSVLLASEPCCHLTRMCQEKSSVLSHFRCRGNSSQWHLGKEVFLQIARTRLFWSFFLLLFSQQMFFLCNRMLSSKTTSTGQTNAHEVAAHHVFTFLRHCLSIKEFILLLLQTGSTE